MSEFTDASQYSEWETLPLTVSERKMTVSLATAFIINYYLCYILAVVDEPRTISYNSYISQLEVEVIKRNLNCFAEVDMEGRTFVNRYLKCIR